MNFYMYGICKLLERGNVIAHIEKDQYWGTVNIFYGSGSDFQKLRFQFRFRFPLLTG
jgi:hypothetical protein